MNHEQAMALEIAEVTHNDWLERPQYAPAWFVEAHKKGWCNMPQCREERARAGVGWVHPEEGPRG